MISHRENSLSMQNGPSRRVKKEPRLLNKDEENCSQAHVPLWTGQTPGHTCLCSRKGVFDVPGPLASGSLLVAGFQGQRPADAWRGLALPRMSLGTLGTLLN